MKLLKVLTFLALGAGSALWGQGSPEQVSADKKNDTFATGHSQHPAATPPETAAGLSRRIEPDTLIKQAFARGDLRSSLDGRTPLEEPKLTFPIEAAKPEERVESPLNRRLAPIQTATNPYPTTVASRFQARLAAAETAASQQKPSLERRLPFSDLNRFVFRRNTPGSEGDAAATPAAGGSPATIR